METAYINIAFISYKREDEKWASWLQKKLEYYQLPSKIKSDYPELEFASRPRHVFKDTTDLSAGVLAEALQQGLDSSKYLIVICSPRAAQSQWVCKEIQSFIDSGREANIIPFIIEGTPHSSDPAQECFPKALLSLSGNRELLAINVSEYGRDVALVKMVAWMFGLRFDVLWQRFRRNKRLRNLGFLLIGVLVTLFSLFFSMAIWKKNTLIAHQNERLSNLVAHLEEENRTHSLSSGDTQPYEYIGQLRGNFCDQMSMLQVIFHPTEPLVAFSDDWGVWLHYLHSHTEIQLPTGVERVSEEDLASFLEFDQFYFSADGTRLVATGAMGTLLWDVATASLQKHFLPGEYDEDSLLHHIPPYELSSEAQHQIHLMGQHTPFILREGKIYVLNPSDSVPVCNAHFPLQADSFVWWECNPIYQEMLFVSERQAALYDLQEKKFTLFFKEFLDASSIRFSNCGEYIRVDNRIYARSFRPDTLYPAQYESYPVSEYPYHCTEDSLPTHAAANPSLKLDYFGFEYRTDRFVKYVQVIRPYTMGNGQEYLQDVLFLDKDKVVAVVAQGKFRVYSRHTWQLLGTLDNYVWSSGGEMMEKEEELSHAESYIASTACVDPYLYVLSSGGILRVYRIDKFRLEAVIVLPVDQTENADIRTLACIHMEKDASSISYFFHEGKYWYKCMLPSLKE